MIASDLQPTRLYIVNPKVDKPKAKNTKAEVEWKARASISRKRISPTSCSPQQQPTAFQHTNDVDG
jgi:hypothetical protein